MLDQQLGGKNCVQCSTVLLLMTGRRAASTRDELNTAS
jgi:hypothetical protein